MKQSIPTFRTLIRKTVEVARCVKMRQAISHSLPENLKKFLIISEPRSGSNLLCGLINSHPQILCFYEMFHKRAIHYGPNNYERYNFGTLIQRDRDPVGFISKIYSPLHGYKAVGLKIFKDHNNVVLNALIKNRDIKKIVLRRQAALHAFTSREIARISKDYILIGKNEKAPKKKHKIKIDVNSFITYVDNRENFYQRVQKGIGNQPHVELDYADIVKGTGKFKNIVPFIGVDDSSSLEALTSKQNPNSLQNRIINFDEVSQSISGTRYAKYLKEELA